MKVVATATSEIGVTNMVYYSVISLPLNDNFTNAIKAPVAGASYLSNNRFATLETGEPYHDGDPNRAASLWWNWTPTNNVNVLIDTMGVPSEDSPPRSGIPAIITMVGCIFFNIILYVRPAKRYNDNSKIINEY